MIKSKSSHPSCQTTRRQARSVEIHLLTRWPHQGEVHAGLPQFVSHVDQRVAPGGVDSREAAHVQDKEEFRRPTRSPLSRTRNAILFICATVDGRLVPQFLQGLLDGGLRLGRVRKVEVPVELERGETLLRVDVLVVLGAEVLGRNSMENMWLEVWHGRYCAF